MLSIRVYIDKNIDTFKSSNPDRISSSLVLNNSMKGEPLGT